MIGFGRKDKKEDKKEGTIFTKELAGMVLILFAALMLVCLITREVVFSSLGRYVNAFLLGVFGYTAYALDLLLIAVGVCLVADKRLPRLGRRAVPVCLAVFALLALLHTISVRGVSADSYGKYLSATYTMADAGFKSSSFGGLLLSLITFIPVKMIGLAGTYAVIGVLLALAVYFSVRAFLTEPAARKERKPREQKRGKNKENADMELRDYPVPGIIPETKEPGSDEGKTRLYVRDDGFELKTKREMASAEKKNESFKILYPNSNKEGVGLGYGATEVKTPAPEDDFKKKIEYIKTPRPLVIPKYDEREEKAAKESPTSTIGVSEPVKPARPVEIPIIDHEEEDINDTVGKRLNDYTRYTGIEETEPAPEPEVKAESDAEERRYTPVYETPEPEVTNVPADFGRRGRDIFKTPEPEVKAEPAPEPAPVPKVAEQPATPVPEFGRRGRDVFKAPEPENVKQPEKKEPEEFVTKIGRVYNRPPLDLFKNYKQDINAPREDHEERSRIIERTLSEFGVDVKVVNCVQGPTVTRYELMMPAGVPVKKVPIHADDIAMRLEAENGVRIEAPIPGKNLVGIEVPNKVKTTVGLRDIIESPKFQNSKPSALMFALGKNIIGECISDDLSKGPHYLVAGATGMGKSVCLNSMIISLITKYSPEELRLILVDPKQVEFSVFNHLPHLMIDEIITNAQKAIATLQWAVDEMEARFTKFGENEVRNIDEYNEEIASDTVPKVPKIVIIVDEVNDLMQYNKRDLEAKIIRLSQKARAAGIHLVLATQRPSVDVITGVIKANLPSKIAFRVNTAVDSGTILGEGGAEKLLGNGDSLYRNAQMAKCERIQGSFISMSEVKNIVSYIKEHNEAYFNDKAAAEIENAIKPQTPDVDDEGEMPSERNLGEDKLFREALKHVINSGSASISMLQRRFSVGYSKAGALVDQMDRMGYVSPFDGSRARQVLITKEEFEKKYGSIDD